MAPIADQIAVDGVAPPLTVDGLERQIAGTRQRISASLSILDNEARALLKSIDGPRRAVAARDTFALSAGVLCTFARIRALKQSGRLTRLGLGIAGLSVGFALLRSHEGRVQVRKTTG